MDQAQFKAKFEDRDRFTFILTKFWSSGEAGGNRHIEILRRHASRPSKVSSRTDTVRRANYPADTKPEWIRDKRGRGGRPISYRFCTALNEQELRRALRRRESLIEKQEEELVIEKSKPHRREIRFYREVINRFLLWFHTHDSVEAPTLGDSAEERSALSVSDKRFVRDTARRRKRILRELLPSCEATEKFSTLKELAERVLDEERELAREKQVADHPDFDVKVNSVVRYFREHADPGSHYSPTFEQRMEAIYYWAHGETDKLKGMHGRR